MEGKSTKELTGDWREEYKITNGGVEGKSTREFTEVNSTRELTGNWRERAQEN